MHRLPQSRRYPLSHRPPLPRRGHPPGGLPVITLPRTLADLIRSDLSPERGAQAVRQALERGMIDESGLLATAHLRHNARRFFPASHALTVYPLPRSASRSGTCRFAAAGHPWWCRNSPLAPPSRYGPGPDRRGRPGTGGNLQAALEPAAGRVSCAAYAQRFLQVYQKVFPKETHRSVGRETGIWSGGGITLCANGWLAL